MAGGNENVVLCERGIRTFEKYTRNTLGPKSVVPIIKQRSASADRHRPQLTRPATGRLVESMSPGRDRGRGGRTDFRGAQ